jgi:hypothetical protein
MRIAVHAAPALVVLCMLPAQPTSVSSGRVRGVVFDSLFTQRPLRDAEVWIDGVAGIVQTDSLGRFVLPSVPPGAHRVTFTHPSLEAVGFEPRPALITVTSDAEQSVTLTTPGAKTMYGLLCGAAPMSDVGMVLAAVREVGSDAVLPIARVSASWNQLHFVDGRSALVRPDVQGRPAGDGGFVVCGVPNDAEVQLTALLDDGRVGVVPHALNGAMVSARPIRVMPVREDERRQLSGVVITEAGMPIARALVREAGDSNEAVADSAGVFRLRDRITTTREVSIRGIGWYPLLWSGEVADQKQFTFELTSIGDVLERIDVRGRRQSSEAPPDFEARRRRGGGTFFTREDIERLRPIETTQLLMRAPGMVVRQDGHVLSARSLATGGCIAAVFLDGLPFLTGPREFPPLQLIHPEMIAAIEVYRGVDAPLEFGGSPCGSIVIWTRRGGRQRSP